MRHRYIVNSPAVRGRYQTYYLGSVEEPAEWQARTEGSRRLPPSWYAGEDYTHEEIEDLFQEGLARFPLQSFDTRTFTDELVFGRFPPIPGLPQGSFCFQREKAFALASVEGEPLELELLTGRIAHYRDRRPTVWRVTDPTGKVIAQGELPLDGQWHSISVNVPAPGTYLFDADDFAAGWGIRSAPGRPCTLKLEKGIELVWLGGAGALAFYVPKGTDAVAYYVEGSAHDVLDPEGRVVAKVPEQPGNIVTVEVPTSAAGKPWAFHGLTPRVLWFYNCPNLVARSAEELMVPRDAAGP